MHRLIDFPLQEPRVVATKRRQHDAAPDDGEAALRLGIALARAGCSYEAALMLRLQRQLWKASPDAPDAKAALDAQAWWNKTWREFAQRSQAGDHDGALALLGDRAVQFWDFPPLLMHLGTFAKAKGQLDLADHIFRRISDLANRGLPKMNMAAFVYAAAANRVDVLLLRGKAADAQRTLAKLKPNPGNAMAHELQTVRVLVANGKDDAAMRSVAAMLTTARKHRAGYSRDIRLDFVDNAADLDGLRARDDWPAMRDNPEAYTKRKRGRKG